MRILITVHGFPPHAQGGSELHAYDLACRLRDGGDTVMVLTRDHDPSRPEFSVRREQRDDLSIRWINNTFASVRRFSDLYDDERVVAAAEPAIDEFAPDIAHIHHLTCLSTGLVPALKARGVPCVMTVHDYWLLCHRGQLLDLDLRRCEGPGASGCGRCISPVSDAPSWVYGLRRAGQAMTRALTARGRSGIGESVASMARHWTTARSGSPGARARGPESRRLAHMRALSQQIALFLAPSRHMRDRLALFGVPEGRIAVIENGTDVERFAAARRARHDVDRGGGAASPLRLGFLGSLMVSKAPHLLLEAASRLPAGSVTVDLYGEPVAYHGDASYADRLAPLLGTSGVRHHGSLPHEAVPSAAAAMDALVVPSIWEENSPLVIREAFAAGVPVVASRIGGIPETVTDGVNGRLFRPGDVDDLSRVLGELAADRQALKQLQQGVGSVPDLADEVRDLRSRLEREVRSAPRITRGTPPAPTARLAAIVLNYRQPEQTLLAVRSLLASDRVPDDLIVVDNDSSGDAREVLAGVLPAIRYLPMRDNLGFAGGVNEGIRSAAAQGARRVLLVNSDAIVRPDCIGRLEDALGQMHVGVVAPILLSRSTPDIVASAGISYDRRLGRMRHPEHGMRYEPATTGRVTVDAVSGCVMLIDLDVFETVGGFDADYFFGFEDIDFCHRVRDVCGRAIVVDHAAIAYHEGSLSIGATSPDRLYFAVRNHLKMARAADPQAGRLRHFRRSAFVVGFNVAHALTAAGATPQARLLAVCRGASDHWRRRYGPAH
jgi:GT2 family glycosyltransferase/glycosyltransferase involved in cell wall biosynthesis